MLFLYGTFCCLFDYNCTYNNTEEIIDENMIFCISVIVIFSFVLFLVALYLLVKNNRILKKIDLYLNDAILVSAKVERWDKIDISYKPYQ